MFAACYRFLPGTPGTEYRGSCTCIQCEVPARKKYDSMDGTRRRPTRFSSLIGRLVLIFHEVSKAPTRSRGHMIVKAAPTRTSISSHQLQNNQRFMSFGPEFSFGNQCKVRISGPSILLLDLFVFKHSSVPVVVHHVFVEGERSKSFFTESVGR